MMTVEVGGEQIKVALFCGGRGSATIIREFLRRSNVRLTLLVNAYDDGLSTGTLRNFIPGMLGPSDFRKNLSYLLDLYSDQQYALKSLVELRLAAEFGPAEELALRNFVEIGNSEKLPSRLADLFRQLHPPTAESVRHYLAVFLGYARNS